MVHAGGRPTVYRPEMPAEMLEMMRNGAKDSWIFAQWHISKDTFYRWLKEHKDLKEAHDQGMPLCEVWWEQKGMDLMNSGDNKSFSYWIAFMNRKFGWNKNNSAEGSTTNIQIGQMNVLNQSRTELLDFIKAQVDDNIDLIEVIPEPIVNESNKSEQQE